MSKCATSSASSTFRNVAARESSRHGVTGRTSELLRLVCLDLADARKYPHEFSAGQRQRIAIACALASNPDFIVCDEPTSALYVSIQTQILNLLPDLQVKLGLTYLLITHNLAVLRFMAMQVAVIYLGRFVEIAKTTDLFARPRHPYMRVPLDAVPDLTMSGRARTPVVGEPPDPIDPPPGCPFHRRCAFAIERCKSEVPGQCRLPFCASRSQLAGKGPPCGPPSHHRARRTRALRAGFDHKSACRQCFFRRPMH